MLCKTRCDARCGAMHMMWPIYGVIWNVAWSTWTVALCGTYCEMGCNARCGEMHNVADTWGDLKYGIAKWNSVLRGEVLWNVRHVEERWCDVDCGVVWNNARDCVWCGMMQCKMWRNDAMRCEMQWQCVIRFHISTFHTKPHFRHSTPYHITPHILVPPDHALGYGVLQDSVVRNLVWCAMFCNARCGMLCLIHPCDVE